MWPSRMRCAARGVVLLLLWHAAVAAAAAPDAAAAAPSRVAPASTTAATTSGAAPAPEQEKKATAEEEEKAPEAKQIAVSWLLLSVAGYQTAVYYLVNSSNNDVVRMTWYVIASTWSIFCAVLLYQGINGYVQNLFGKTESGLLLVGFPMLAWIGLMQMALAYFSDTFSLDGLSAMKEKLLSASRSLGKSQSGSSGEADAQSTLEKAENLEAALKCWSTLFAHMLGFTMIEFYCVVMGEPFFAESWGKASLVVLVAVLVSATLCQATYTIRLLFYAASKQVPFSEAKEKLGETSYEDEAREAENDAIGLALSFTTIQVLRFMIIGTRPTGINLQRGTFVTKPQVLVMGLFCMLFALLLVAATQMSAKLAGYAKNLEQGEGRIKKTAGFALDRALQIFKNYAAMSFAFAMLFTIKYALTHKGSDSVSVRVFIALVITLISGLLILGLNHLDGRLRALRRKQGHLGLEDWLLEERKAVMKTLRKFMLALAIVIGLSWEQAFDEAVDTLAETHWANLGFDSHLKKLMLAIILVSTVLPAHRYYVQPMVLKKEEERLRLDKELMAMIDADSNDTEERSWLGFF